MGLTTYIHHFIVSHALTLYYNVLVLISFALRKLKSPFSDPWALKLNLVPPASLADPKYGVHKYIKANNIKLHYVESGDPSKPLVIFVHGFPEFWYSWRHQIVEFNKDYWCIAVDMRGYGDSERPEGVSEYKLEILVEDLRDLVRQLGREKCVLVSHDWGGIIASKFRDIYPDVCNAVILLASTSVEAFFEVLWDDPQQRKMSWYIFFYQMPVIPEKLLQMDNLAVFDKIMLIPGKDTITQNDIQCYKYWFGKQYTLTPPVNYYRANFLYDLQKKERCDKKVPFLVALAEKDIFISKRTLDIIKQKYSCIETTIIEGCTHFMQQEDPEKVNSLIRGFLAKNNL